MIASVQTPFVANFPSTSASSALAPAPASTSLEAVVSGLVPCLDTPVVFSSLAVSSLPVSVLKGNYERSSSSSSSGSSHLLPRAPTPAPTPAPTSPLALGLSSSSQSCGGRAAIAIAAAAASSTITGAGARSGAGIAAPGSSRGLAAEGGSSFRDHIRFLKMQRIQQQKQHQQQHLISEICAQEIHSDSRVGDLPTDSSEIVVYDLSSAYVVSSDSIADAASTSADFPAER
jgi:hypothetical protein